MVTLPSSVWDAMEEAVKIMRPFALATDICQSDNASVATVLQHLRKLPAHFQALGAEAPNLSHFLKAAQVMPHEPSYMYTCASLLQDKCDARWLKNFESPEAEMINLFDPNIDQSEWDDIK